MASLARLPIVAAGREVAVRGTLHGWAAHHGTRWPARLPAVAPEREVAFRETLRGRGAEHPGGRRVGLEAGSCRMLAHHPHLEGGDPLCVIHTTRALW